MIRWTRPPGDLRETVIGHRIGWWALLQGAIDGLHDAFRDLRYMLTAIGLAVVLLGCAAMLAATPAITAGLVAVSSIAEAVTASRGAPLTPAQYQALEARVAALEAAEREEQSCHGATTDAGPPGEYAAALERESIAKAEGARTRVLLADLVRVLSVPVADGGAVQ